MSRLLMGLCVFGLTVAVVSFVGADDGATGAKTVFKHPTINGKPYTILQIAKKPVRKKGTAKKTEDADSTDEMAKDDNMPAAKAAGPAVSDAKGIVFSRDVAPILVANCFGCHGDKDTKGDLNLTTYNNIMSGAKGDKILVPGNPDESEIVIRINGGAAKKKKMPPGNMQNLGEHAIAKITEWIKDGATLDIKGKEAAKLPTYAPNADQIRRVELTKMTSEERDKIVEASALDRWKKGSPKTTPEIETSKNFVLLSNLPKTRAASTLKVMDAQLAQVKALIGPQAFDSPLKITLLVFKDKNSFVEFARGYEGREVEADETGSARFDGLEPYVAVVDPGRDEAPASTSKKSRAKKSDDDDGAPASRTLPGVLTEQLAIGAANKGGKPPRWLTLGLGAYLASRHEAGSPYIAKLRKDAWDLCDQGWTTKAVEAMGDQTKPEDTRAVGYAMVDWMSKVDKAALAGLVRGLMAGGDKLDDVIGNVLNGTREQFLAGSGEYVMSNYGGRR